MSPVGVSKSLTRSANREIAYRKAFRRKWGHMAERVFLSGDWDDVLGSEAHGLAQAGRWRDLLDLTQRHRSD